MSSILFNKNSVIYQVFIDRFNKGGAEEIPPFATKTHSGKKAPGDIAPGHFLGGNLWGVIEKLDYIQSLGANVVWISPPQQNMYYHGYHITNLDKTDTRFGGEEAFTKLVEEVHKRGMKLMMDFVPNHIGSDHPWFQEAKNNPESPKRNWFYFDKDNKYKCFMWYGEQPKLNLDHPECRKEVIGSMKRWLDKGVDGFRMDHVIGPSMDFWKECRDELKAHKPEMFMIAEAWFHNIGKGDLHTMHGLTPEESLEYWELQEKRAKLEKRASRENTTPFSKKIRKVSAALGDIQYNKPAQKYHELFDGMLDFGFQFLMQQMVKGILTDEELAEKLRKHRAQFKGDCISVPFTGNHDMDTLLCVAGNDEAKMKKAIEMQMQQPGIPVIYQGEEFGKLHRQLRPMAEADVVGEETVPGVLKMPGHESWWGDLMVREPLHWPRLKGNFRKSLIMNYKEAIAKRRSANMPQALENGG